jgi:hypothetical protein
MKKQRIHITTNVKLFRWSHGSSTTTCRRITVVQRTSPLEKHYFEEKNITHTCVHKVAFHILNIHFVTHSHGHVANMNSLSGQDHVNSEKLVHSSSRVISFKSAATSMSLELHKLGINFNATILDLLGAGSKIEHLRMPKVCDIVHF